MKKRAAILSILLFLGVDSYCENSEIKTITLKEAIDTALSRNKTRLMTKTSLEIAKALHKQALSARYPSLDLSLSAVRKDKDPSFLLKGDVELPQNLSNALALATATTPNQREQIMQAIKAGTLPKQKIPLDMDIKLADRDILTGSLNLRYPIYTGGKVSSLIKESELGVLNAKKDLIKNEDEIRYLIKRYYYGALLAQNLKKVARDSEEKTKVICELTEKLYKGESMRVKKTDYLKCKLTLSLIKNAKEETKEREKEAKAALIYAMGEDYTKKIVLKEPEREEFKDDGLQKTVKKAFEKNPLLQKLSIAEKIYEEKIKEAKSANLPQIALFGEAKKIQSDFINDEDKNSWLIGVGAKLSLFNGFRTQNEILEAKLKRKKITLQKELYKEALALKVKRAYFKLLRSKKQLDILKKALKIAKENRELNIRAYEQDLVETRDVLQAQIMETTTMKDYYLARYDYEISLAELERLLSL